jgi:hypothetical protein
MSETASPQTTYRLELTPPEMKITHAALKAFLNDFGHDEREVQEIAHRVLRKLPDDTTVSEIRI